MKVFVATKETQGQRPNDFFFGTEGELVKFGSECDEGSADDKCGCHRCMIGFDTNKAVTTFKVVHMNMTMEKYQAKYRESLIASGWVKLMTEKELDTWVKEDTKALVHYADVVSIGIPLEKRGNAIQIRHLDPPAKTVPKTIKAQHKAKA